MSLEVSQNGGGGVVRGVIVHVEGCDEGTLKHSRESCRGSSALGGAGPGQGSWVRKVGTAGAEGEGPSEWREGSEQPTWV